MNAEGFELAVATIILLRRVWRKRFKRKNRKQWVRAIFNERKEKIAKWENHTNIGIFLQLLLKFHLFLNYICLFSPCLWIFFKQWMLTLKFPIFLINQITYFNNITSILSLYFHISNKKQSKTYKFNRRPKTMVGIPLK